jgi:hypothetical protein
MKRTRKYVIRQKPRRHVSVSVAAAKKGWRTRRKLARAAPPILLRLLDEVQAERRRGRGLTRRLESIRLCR